MDPGLEEAILRTPPGEDIEAIALLQPGRPTPGALRVVTRFGRIVTCRIPAESVRTVRADPAVVSLKAARVIEPADTLPVLLEHASGIGLEPRARVASGIPRLGPVVIGVLDWGLDFVHPAFRRADGSTRLLAFWDQRDSALPPAPDNPYGYGRIVERSRIDRALAEADPYSSLAYHPVAADPRGIGAHGTLVTSIAAGSSTAPAGAQGIATHAELAFVHLATGVLPDMSNLGDSVRILEGIDFIRRVAGTRPWVVNCSLGRTGGDHTGRSLVEMAMDHVVHEAPGRAIVQSAGNYFDKRLHAQGLVRTGGVELLEWRIAPNDPTTNELEVWYSGRDTFALELIPPAADEGFRVELGERVNVDLDGRHVGRAYHREHEPITGDHHIDIFLEPVAPSGSWRVKLIGRDVADGRFHAWIERDTAVPNAQSRFAPEQASPRSTLGTIATTYRTYVVGAATSDRRGVASFSSSGPTRDGRIKPDLLAPGVAIVGARSTPAGAPPGSGGLTAQSGTSMAAPHVSGTIALLYAAAPRKLAAPETRALVLGSSERITGLDPDRSGSGLLDTEATLDALGTLRVGRQSEVTPHSTLDQIESAIDRPHARRAFRAALDAARGHLPPDLQLVGNPGSAPRGGVRPDDVIVRVNPGEPVAPLVGRIVSETTWAAGAETWGAEPSGPGYYARIAPLHGPAGVASARSRRVLDRSGCLSNDQLLLRPSPPDLAPDDWSATEQAGPIDWCVMRQTIAATARAEEARWTRPNGVKFVESDPSRLRDLTRYWSMVPGFTDPAAAAAAAHDSAHDLRGGEWSAAFICFVMRTAGVREIDGLEFSQRHMNYIVGALRNRERGDHTRPFWLVDRLEIQHEAFPEPGDLICFNRPVDGVMTRHSYESLRNQFWSGGNEHRPPRGSSHTSLVVGAVNVGGARFVETIGGNEAQSVRVRRFPIGSLGEIQNPDAHNIFGMIKLIAC